MSDYRISNQSVVTPSTHAMAIASLVFGILGLTFFIIGSIIALITGKKALKEIQADSLHYTGEDLAKAGVIMGWIGIALFIVAIFTMGSFLIILMGNKFIITYVEILIFITAMFFVGYPVFSKRQLAVGSRQLADSDELIHKKEAAYTAIKDLEFDYRTGKLSEADYNDLKEKYETDALHILKQIDEYGKKIPLSPLPNLGEGGFVFCPKCGAKTKTGDNFCSKCGTKLS